MAALLPTAASSSPSSCFNVRRLVEVLLIIGVVQLHLCCSCSATVFQVGGSDGWSLKPNFTLWAQQYTYQVGDTLQFNYKQGTHSVYQVNKADYQNCTAGRNALFSDSQGDTMFPLTMAGKYWFICGVEGHCSKGMKFSIEVSVGSSLAPSPSTMSNDATATQIGLLVLLGTLLAGVFLLF